MSSEFSPLQDVIRCRDVSPPCPVPPGAAGPEGTELKTMQDHEAQSNGRADRGLRKLKLPQWCSLHKLWISVLIFAAVILIVQALGIMDIRVKYEELLQPWISQVSSYVARTPEKTCQPEMHVMFLKTHKTASSTVLNILYRFGDARNLTFALPFYYRFDYPYFFKATMVKSYSSRNAHKFHIICNHMRFHKPQVEKVMPSGTFYVSIIRNPVTLMESSFHYNKWTCLVFNKVDSLEQFLANPWKYYVPESYGSHFARNAMWFDFGFDHNANDTEEYVDFVINEIGETFHLILLSEYFDESMVLLKDALCWEFDDVLSFKLNVRSNVTVGSLSEADVERIKAWNSLDWKLYLHFNRTFWQKVEQYGRKRMADDILVLRSARKELAELCLNGSSLVHNSQIQDSKLKPYQPGNVPLMGYNLNSNLNESTREKCLRMVLPELQYKDLLDAKTFPLETAT